MPVSKVKTIDINSINNFKKLLNELHALEKTLPDSELHKLSAFNSTYIVITTAIKEASNNGYFENTKFIENFTLNFANYYFQIINDALAGNDNMPIAWSNLLFKKTDKQLPNFIYLLMGANAHINYDLSLVMVKMLDNDDTESIFKDIIKVDKLILDCGNDILRTFTETKKIPRFIKDKTKYIYLPIVMHIILYWRVKAWKDYRNIKNNGLRPDRAYIKGKATSLRLLRLGLILQA